MDAASLAPPVGRPVVQQALKPLWVVSLVLVASVACAPADARDTSALRGPGCPAVAGQTVRWIVPFTPGGGYDVYSRLIEPHYERVIGAEIVVENRTGASGRVGARTVRDAEPDGLTLGLVNGTSLMIDGMLDPQLRLHPVEDFTPIGRIAVSDPVLMAARTSRYRTWEQILDRGDSEPLVFGQTGVGGTGWIWSLLASEVLELDVVQVSGYPGTRETSMALIRGEVDLSGFTFESMLDRTRSGDLVPILRISSAVDQRHPELREVPALVGPDGVAAARARELGRDPAPRVALAEAIDRVLSSGRLVLAPAGLDPEVAACLQAGLATVLADPGFLESARRAARSIHYGDPELLAAQLVEARADLERMGSLVQEHVAAARGRGAP